jgi:FMN phosphatase YigB (HAD superfamily)
MSNVILTDVDGVLLNWEYAFDVWMQRKGYRPATNSFTAYQIGDRYKITPKLSKELIRYFNESAAIGFLPPLRDAMYYVRKLHEEHGYVFHVITSLSDDDAPAALRIMNLKKLFGETVFEKFVFLDTGADKDKELAKYRGTGYWWVEDKPENAAEGAKNGLQSLLIEHGYNMNNKTFPLMKNWKHVYETVTGL